MFSDGEDGCIDLANEITKMGPNTKHFDIYDLNDDLFTKIDKIKDMFYAKEIVYSDEVKAKLELINENNKLLETLNSKNNESDLFIRLRRSIGYLV